VAVPLGIAAFAFGVSFGVLARSAGMSGLAAVVMSATTFGGSAQFGAASILLAGGGVIAAVAAAVLLNLRYGPIGLSAAPSLPAWWPRWRRLLGAQMVTDESWAVAQPGGGPVDGHLLRGAGVLLWVGWVGGTALGAVAGRLVADPGRFGLDAAFPALFLALLVGQVRSRSRLLAALTGGAIALALIPLTSPGVPILAASLACLVGLRGTGQEQERGQDLERSG